MHVLAIRDSNVFAKVPRGNGKCLSPLTTGDTRSGWEGEFAQVQTDGDDAYVLFTGGGSFYPGSFYLQESWVAIESAPEGFGVAGRRRPNSV